MHTENRTATDILIVEDDPTIIELLKEALTDEGYDVRSAANGLEGWLAIESAPPALLLTDIRMPVMSGTELVTRVRARGYTFPIVILAATAALAAPLVQPGRTAYIAKPFMLDTLLATVAQYGVVEGVALTGS
jgi:two-component system, OmpR family, response regulator MprA